MTTMLEKMARAIGESYDGYADPVDTPNNWSRATSAARAALQAIREPSDHTGGMVDVGYETMRHREVTTHSDARKCFTAMIEAILSEGEA